jgi:hypothetical protein
MTRMRPRLWIYLVVGVIALVVILPLVTGGKS